MKKNIYLTKNLSDQIIPNVKLSGSVSIPAPNSHFKRIPREWILYIILQGTMTIQEDDTIYTLLPGDAFFLSPNRCHTGIPVDDSIQYYYVHFQWGDFHEKNITTEEYLLHKQKEQDFLLNPLAHNVTPDLFFLPKKTTLLPEFFDRTLSLISQILTEQKNISCHQTNIENSLFYVALMLISRSETQRIASQNLTTALIPALLAYLKNHLSDKITGETLEKEFHHNFDYMNRKFRENTGKTIFQYLQECRIQESKHLLLAGHYSITEIADQLGYCNSFYFSKVFRQKEGITPSEYRKIRRNV